MAKREPEQTSDTASTTMRRVNWAKELEVVRRLFQEYRQWLADHQAPARAGDSRSGSGLGLVDRLIAGLPGAYGPPRGDVILAFAQNELVACGALRELEPGAGEIKRVHVRADHRGPVFGPRLTGALLDRARELGYERIRVDTLPTMAAAIQFYQDMGFTPISAYWPHPVPGALFFECRLSDRAGTPRRVGVSKKRTR
jgi:ribosomal protein S18 acetylase RimI-like enzyme